MQYHLSRVPSDAELSEWLRQHFPANRFAINRDAAPDEFYIELSVSEEGDFPCLIWMSLPGLDYPAERTQAVSLATAFKCSILVSDEELDPYTYVLVTPEGELFWVNVDVDALERNAMVVTSPVTLAEGSLVSATALDPVALTHAMSTLLKTDASRIDVEQWSQTETMSSSPDPIVDGIPYCFTYLVFVDWERRPWRTRLEESARWERIVSQLAASWGQSFCIYTRHHVPRGGKSKSRCIWVDGASRREITREE